MAVTAPPLVGLAAIPVGQFNLRTSALRCMQKILNYSITNFFCGALCEVNEVITATGCITPVGQANHDN